ncbi:MULTISPECIES: GtrA family protein [Achromobacter]|uniref:GtrA family protein n=1 Tax=Achromobacter TaxID=222 RepID=UPI0025C64932|nr:MULTISPECIES: GtrA family protein [Achromobacter]
MRSFIEKWTQFKFSRFLVSGAFNTAATYLIYLILLRIFSYQVSYSIAYALGIILAYVLNRIYVFKSHRGLASAFMMPVVYAVQYGMGMVVIYLWVDVLLLSAKVAPLIAVAVTIPITYLLSRLAFATKGDGEQDSR